MEITWNYLTELRKELVESQKIRAQVIGFKITFVTTAIGLIGTNLDRIPSALLVVPAFASIFFDFLINSYSFAIKRIGYYIKTELEPELRNIYKTPKSVLLWEEFLRDKRMRPKFALIGNVGLTVLAISAAVVGLCIPFRPLVSPALMTLLALFVIIDFTVYLIPFKLGDERIGNE